MPQQPKPCELARLCWLVALAKRGRLGCRSLSCARRSARHDSRGGPRKQQLLLMRANESHWPARGRNGKAALELWNVRALECQTCALARVQMHAPDRRQRSHGVSRCRALLASWLAPLSHSRRRMPEDGLCKLAQPHHQPRHHRSDSTAATATAEPRAAASPGCGGEGAMARTWWCAARRRRPVRYHLQLHPRDAARPGRRAWHCCGCPQQWVVC